MVLQETHREVKILNLQELMKKFDIELKAIRITENVFEYQFCFECIDVVHCKRCKRLALVVSYVSLINNIQLPENPTFCHS